MFQVWINVVSETSNEKSLLLFLSNLFVFNPPWGQYVNKWNELDSCKNVEGYNKPHSLAVWGYNTSQKIGISQ